MISILLQTKGKRVIYILFTQFFNASCGLSSPCFNCNSKNQQKKNKIKNFHYQVYVLLPFERKQSRFSFSETEVQGGFLDVLYQVVERDMTPCISRFLFLYIGIRDRQPLSSQQLAQLACKIDPNIIKVLYFMCGASAWLI